MTLVAVRRDVASGGPTARRAAYRTDALTHIADRHGVADSAAFAIFDACDRLLQAERPRLSAGERWRLALRAARCRILADLDDLPARSIAEQEGVEIRTVRRDLALSIAAADAGYLAPDDLRGHETRDSAGDVLAAGETAEDREAFVIDLICNQETP